MKIEYMISEEDYDIIEEYMKSGGCPCIICGQDSTSCTGCDDFKSYRKIMEKVENNNLKDICLVIDKVRDITKTIKENTVELNTSLNSMEEIVGQGGLMRLFGFTRLNLEKQKKGDEK